MVEGGLRIHEAEEFCPRPSRSSAFTRPRNRLKPELWRSLDGLIQFPI